MPTPVPLFDLSRVLMPHRPALHAALERCLTHGIFVLGPEVAQFEKQLATYLGTPQAIGLSSGTDSLLATFLALISQGRLQPGDEILTTAFTFIASATSILRAGLRPVFVDIAPGHFHPQIADYEQAWGPKTRGVLIVHLFGEPQPLDEIAQLCADNNGVMIEDCAQAIGAVQPDGRAVGTRGLAGTLSFFPAKNLGTLGDGGAAYTADPELGQRIREIRQHGMAAKYQHQHLGGNFRLDALHAAFLAVLLPELGGWIAARRQHAARYTHEFKTLSDRGLLTLPGTIPGHAWNQYVIRTPHRDRVKAHLDSLSIGNAIYYPSALHVQGALRTANPPAALANTDRACQEVLALPIYPGLQEYEQALVIQAVTDALNAA